MRNKMTSGWKHSSYLCTLCINVKIESGIVPWQYINLSPYATITQYNFRLFEWAAFKTFQTVQNVQAVRKKPTTYLQKHAELMLKLMLDLKVNDIKHEVPQNTARGVWKHLWTLTTVWERQRSLTWRPWIGLHQTAHPHSSYSPGVQAWWQGLQLESGCPPPKGLQLLASCQTLSTGETDWWIS